MNRTLKMIVEYDGTAYHGWQYQDNAGTVQGTIEIALTKLLGEKIRITGSGRTDAGVHARGQVASFRTANPLECRKIGPGLNAWLPDDIRIKLVEEAGADFNARYSAKKRVYQYYLATEQTALYRFTCWQFFQPLDEQILHELAGQVIGVHDFGAFSKVQVQSEHKLCHVFESRWTRQDRLLVYRIAANRFLHGMVRSIVGTMVDVARGRFTVGEFGEIFAARDRTKAGTAAPAKGLVLEAVEY